MNGPNEWTNGPNEVGHDCPLVNGASVERDMKRIRRSLGVCPQFDVLWPQLTVREHLFMYARFRGLSERGMEAEVEEKIASVGLTSKAGCQAGTLSGGQKRKLSVAIAFVGDPEVVMVGGRRSRGGVGGAS